MKVLFLVMHRPNRSPSQRFRFEQYLEFLSANGIESDISYLISEKDDPILYSPGNYLGKAGILFNSYRQRFRDLNKLSKYDYVFIQREAFLTGSTFFERKIAKSGIPIIFDFDDSIWIQDFNASNKKWKWLKNPNKTSKIIQLATKVIAGNKYLADYAATYNEDVIIIPTTIDTEAYKPVPQKESEAITIGWSGSFSTVKHFETIAPALKSIKKTYKNKVRFELIGDSSYRNHELELQGKPWKLSHEVSDLSMFDIGIMPLPDDEWAKGKCGLKGLQYMALEIPTIMSPVGVNSEIIQNGRNGFLAKSTDDWINALKSLIEDKPKMRSVGQKGRKTVLENYSVDLWKGFYLDLFESLKAL